MKNDILDEIRQQACLSDEETATSEFSTIKEKFVVDDNVDYPDPEYLIRIGDVPTLPKGNLVAVSAKWKNGKTFFCDILAGIFLGSNIYKNCENLIKQGKVQFFDTEQAVSDTARIRKTIKSITPHDRHGDLEVFCLRNAVIDSDEQSEEISRYEFIRRSIEHDRPDLVVIDGIADLIYNYNDVNESQDIVNKLAAIANEFNCCIVVVMHQNKGKQDKSMKGHIGTMLYQKCSDEFIVEKHGTLFTVIHDVSRHRQSCGLVFKLDEKAIPMDAAADRQLQLEIEQKQKEIKQQQKIAEIQEQVAEFLPKDGSTVKKKDVVEEMQKRLGFQPSSCYNMLNAAIASGAVVAHGRLNVALVTA